MDRDELKKILARVGVAGLMAGGGIALTAQPAMCAWGGSKKGAVSTPAAQKVVSPSAAVKEVKSIQELEALLTTLEPGKDVKIVYKIQGKEIILEGSAKKSE